MARKKRLWREEDLRLLGVLGGAFGILGGCWSGFREFGLGFGGFGGFGGLGVWGFGGLGFGVWGLGFGVGGLEFGVRGLRGVWG